MEIILARHGKPDVGLWVWITPQQMKNWVQAYHEASVLTEGAPTSSLNKARTSGIVVCSCLRRSVESARVLSQTDPALTDAIFSEADLPHLNWRFPWLPLYLWAVLFRLAWFFGFSSHVEPLSQATLRAREAAKRLVELAEQKDSVFLVGHGIMNQLIAKHLLALGWTGPKRPASQHWQFTVYQTVRSNATVVERD